MAPVGRGGGRELGFATAGTNRSTVKGGANGERVDDDEGGGGGGGWWPRSPDLPIPARRIMAISRVSIDGGNET